MISNRILQTTVDGLKAISRVDLCIVDADKNVAAKTFDNVSECLADAISFIDSPAESQAPAVHGVNAVTWVSRAVVAFCAHVRFAPAPPAGRCAGR